MYQLNPLFSFSEDKLLVHIPPANTGDKYNINILRCIIKTSYILWLNKNILTFVWHYDIINGKEYIKASEYAKENVFTH